MFVGTETNQPIWTQIKQTYPGLVRFVFRHQVQPWHPQSTMLHEAALAVAQISPSRFFDFSKVLFEHAADYYDAKTYTQSRMQIYESLAQLSEKVSINADAVLALLTRDTSDPSAQNGGNKITNDLKRAIKFGRQNGIHVSPTTLFNGIVENAISSSWTWNEWQTYLAKNIDKDAIKLDRVKAEKSGVVLAYDSLWDSNEVYDSVLSNPSAPARITSPISKD